MNAVEAVTQPDAKVVNDTVRRVRYECAECGAEDFHKLYVHEPAPLAVNCWKCHSGQGVEMANMIARQQGMFPTGEVDEKNKPIEPAE